MSSVFYFLFLCVRWFSYFATSFHYGDTPPSFPQIPKSLPARLWLVYFKPRQENKTKWASWKHFDFKEFAEGQQSRDVLKVKYSHYEFYCKHVYSETSFCWQCLKQNKGSCKIYNYHFVLSWVIFLELFFFFPPFCLAQLRPEGCLYSPLRPEQILHHILRFLNFPAWCIASPPSSISARLFSILFFD